MSDRSHFMRSPGKVLSLFLSTTFVYPFIFISVPLLSTCPLFCLSLSGESVCESPVIPPPPQHPLHCVLIFCTLLPDTGKHTRSTKVFPPKSIHALTGEREERPTTYHYKYRFVSKLMEAGGCGGCWTSDHRLAQRVQVAFSCFFCWGGGGGGT